MLRRRKTNERRARARAMLGVAGVLLPNRPRTAIWLMSREPARSELQHAVRTVRAVLWPQVAWVAAGALGAAAIAWRRAARAADASDPVAAEPAQDEATEAVPLAASATTA